MAIALFWPHLTGNATFVGDSDRLSHHLTWLRHLADGLRDGYMPTWNEAMFGGFSTAALPYAFPNPFALLALAWPATELTYAAGIISCLLLVFAGWAAYLFLRNLSAPFPAFVGAAVYMMSALSLLRISQNDTSFTVMLITPLALWAVHRAGRGSCMASFSILALALAYMFFVGFLQEAAYVSLIIGIYAVGLSLARRDSKTLIVTVAAAFVGCVGAFPRIYTVGHELLQSVRHYSTGTSRDFETVYREANTVFPTQILRWFDDRIFGLTMPEVDAHNAGINLHEGLVLYASSFTAFLIVFGALRYIPLWLIRDRRRTAEATIFLAFLAFAMFVALTKPGYWVMYQLFAHIDFMHGRIVAAAILPQAALVSIFLYALMRPRGSTPLSVRPAVLASSIATAAILIVIIEVVAAGHTDVFALNNPPWSGPPAFLASAASLRVSMSFGLFLVVLALITLTRRLPAWRSWLGCLLGFLIVGQIFAYAQGQIAGPQMRTDGPPFLQPVRLLAKANEFQGPSGPALAAVRERLDADRYRTAIVCDRNVITVPCSSYVSVFWRLRMIEGYVSSLPERVAALPWGDAMSLRYITFWTPQALPWPLLGLFNVRSAIVITPSLVTNAVTSAGGSSRELSPSDLEVLDNPAPVTPRIFFAQSVQPTDNLSATLARMFPGGNVDKAGYDVVRLSYVEGYPTPEEFVTTGDMRTTWHDQNVKITVDPADRPRFLVVNDRYDPDWHAIVGGTEVPLYPVNVFMQGLVVPAGAQTIALQYRPFVTSLMAWGFYSAAGFLLIFGSWLIMRYDRSE